MIMSAGEFRNPSARGWGALGEALSNALCACVVAYCIVSFIAGRAGLIAYRDLSSGIGLMNGRIAALMEENRDLTEVKTALESDSDRIAREARNIGYIRPGETIVTFTSGSPIAEDSGGEELERLRAGDSTGLPDRLIKLLSVLTGVAVLLSSLLMSFSPVRKASVRTSANQA